MAATLVMPFLCRFIMPITINYYDQVYQLQILELALVLVDLSVIKLYMLCQLTTL